MSLAIGSGSFSGAVGSCVSKAALHAEVARYQKQLSDAVNCPSSKTLEGKTHIQELTNKISVDQEQIRRIEANPAGNDAAANADTYTNAGVSAVQAAGSLVNVYA
jgi:hypothetical protein